MESMYVETRAKRFRDAMMLKAVVEPRWIRHMTPVKKAVR